MRSIRKILGTDEKVWVYIDSRETWEDFVVMTSSEGFSFGELPAEKWSFGHVVAVHRNGDMGHFSLFVWCRSFSADLGDFPRKIDLGRYIESEDEISCCEPHFKCIFV